MLEFYRSCRRDATERPCRQVCRRYQRMTGVSKLIWVLFALCWGVVRYRYARRARRNRQIEERDRNYEILLLVLSFAGYAGVPVLYLATAVPIAIAGAIFSALRYQTDNLAGSIVAHWLVITLIQGSLVVLSTRG